MKIKIEGTTNISAIDTENMDEKTEKKVLKYIVNKINTNLAGSEYITELTRDNRIKAGKKGVRQKVTFKITWMENYKIVRAHLTYNPTKFWLFPDSEGIKYTKRKSFWYNDEGNHQDFYYDMQDFSPDRVVEIIQSTIRAYQRVY